jgi:cell wall-associated NlpC family hydrolase
VLPSILVAALALSSAACATTRAATNMPVPRPFPGAPTVVAPPAGGSAPADLTVDPGVVGTPVETISPELFGDRLFDGRSVAQFAMGFRGVPYRLGGSDPTGFDCSGLVQYVFAQYGIAVPRIVEEQYEVGDKIDPSDIKPGDLIFFNTKTWGGGASHVAISIGGDSFVHAPNSTGVVRVETLGSSYWGSRYIGARRLAEFPAN